MILSLNLENSYGTQNEDIAKKNKITRITVPVQTIKAQEDSDVGNVTYGPITIESTGNTQEKIVSTSIANVDIEYFLFHKTFKSPKFPSYVGTVLYKNYSITLDLNSYENLRNIKNIPAYDFTFSGTRYELDAEDEYILMYKEFFKIQYKELVSELKMVDFVDGLDNLPSKIDFSDIFDISKLYKFWGKYSWTDTNDFINNIYKDSNNVESNIYSEITDFIQEGNDEVRKVDSNKFTNLNEYVKPKILNWNNNGTTITFNISIPQSIYLFGSKSGRMLGYYNQNYDAEYAIAYYKSKLFKYVFNSLNLEFILNYEISTTDETYHDGKLEYTAEESPLFNKKNYTKGTNFDTVIKPDGTTEIRYDSYYAEDFANQIYEKYKNGKLEININYPAVKIKTSTGLDVVYVSNYGICTKIGDRYFNQDGDEVSLSETDVVTEFVQIPEGTVCEILKSGKHLYTNQDGSPKYFIVKTSNLVYNGILLNELTLMETTLSSKSNFDSVSWSEIDAIGELGELDKYFKVGDKKYITVSSQPNTPVPLVILGFNHDYIADDSGAVKAGMTVGMESVLDKEEPMNNTTPSVLSWKDCDFRNNTIPKLMERLPNDLKSVIKTVEKTSLNNSSDTKTYITTKDNLFLLSVAEITGTDYINNNASLNVGADEGTQYEYWKTIKNGTIAEDRQKKNYVAYDTTIDDYMPVSWGTRSIDKDTGYGLGFYEINRDGYISSSLSTNKFGISYAFGIGRQEVNLPTTDLENATWQQIKYVSNEKIAEQYFKVGDTKKITLTNGMELELVIVGFNHDDLSSGSGKANITFAMKNTISDFKAKMVETNTNIGGWENSYMRNTIMPYIMELLPIDLKKVISEVSKKSSSGGKNQTIVTTNDKLWLFSLAEVTFDADSSGYVLQGEGSRYEYYQQNDENSWTYERRFSRSPSINNTSGWNLIDDFGTIVPINSGTEEKCILFGFSI